MNFSVSRLNSMSGEWKGGKAPWISPTRAVSNPPYSYKPIAMSVTTMMPARPEGKAFVIFGKAYMIAMVTKTSPERIYSGVPESHTSVGTPFSCTWKSPI